MTRVHVKCAILNRSNTNASVAQGAVLIYNSQPASGISNVDLSDVTITNTRSSAPWQVGILAGTGVGATRIGMYPFTLAANPAPLTRLGTPLTWNTQGWLVDGQAVADHTSFAA